MVLCMDTPSVKSTYSAQIKIPAPLVAVMSAEFVKSHTGAMWNTFVFNQTIPVPTYLIALGVGIFKSGKVGPRFTASQLN